MNLTIEIPDDIAAMLKGRPQAQGISVARFAIRVIE